MPRFSANLGFLWPDRPLLDRIAAAADAGFRAVEMHWPYEVPALDVKAALDFRGLSLLGINTARGDVAKGENGLGALAGREAEFQAAVDQSIRFCLEAGGSAVHCMAGFVPPTDRDAAREVFVANLREASAKAEPYGLTLLIEPLNTRDAPGYFYATVDEGIGLVEAVGRSNVKLMFDCYHIGVMGDDVIAKLELHYALIGHVQIAAVPSRAEPDEGELSYWNLFHALDRLGYAGWVGCEYKPRAATDAGLAWIETLGVTL